jgi:hypothetical protein
MQLEVEGDRLDVFARDRGWHPTHVSGTPLA